jgi:hypothetical protein
MGMPGSETCLQELMSRVLGDLVQEGCVSKIHLPLPNDALWIVTDSSVKNKGIAATLYIHHTGKLHLAGFFNAKLCKHQVIWFPCKIDALSISAAIKHFAQYIIQSVHTTQVLTNSRPCVQTYNNVNQGEFSASSRVTTFLSTVLESRTSHPTLETHDSA